MAEVSINMNIREALKKTKVILIPEGGPAVFQTCADLLQAACPDAVIKNGAPAGNSPAGTFALAVEPSDDKTTARLQITTDGGGALTSSSKNLLYAYTSKLIEDLGGQDVADYAAGRTFDAAFKWHRPLYDYLLTQVWRTAEHFDAEYHIQEMARSGYTHIEVNGMSQPNPMEPHVPGEFYSQFYAYCLGLDQFVYSDINKGIYPFEYLNANLQLMKTYVKLAEKYGLDTGIVCFEPRSVPEKFFDKYPTLRGARIDHPLRSRKPRYSLSLAHPLAQEHYEQLLSRIMEHIPDLSYMSVWSNDSGAGFEYTSSLYVGRNGGPYLIREWRTHEQIAEVAGKNIVHFLRILKNAAHKTNPDFRVSLRLEPFKVEHDVIMRELESHMDIEVPSMLVRGYDLPYKHNKYSDIQGIAGSVQHTKLEKEEAEIIAKNKERGVGSHMIFTHGNGFSFEPLLGTTFPWMLHEKLQAMHDAGLEYAANLGGFTPSSLAPYSINQEVFRNFMLDASMNVDDAVTASAVKWAGEDAATQLVDLWRTTENAIRGIPPLPLYSHFGFVWLRTWTRPIIPDLLAVPDEDRQYYEDFMVTSRNNTNLTDLGRDVLFDLISKEYGESFVKRVDENVLPGLDAAIALATELAAQYGSQTPVFQDQADRITGLKCWVGSQRCVAAWVAGVYNYLGTDDAAVKKTWRAYLDDAMDQEIANAQELLALWEAGRTTFMVCSEVGETAYIYGQEFGSQVKRKIELMQQYRHVEPRIDQDILWSLR